MVPGAVLLTKSDGMRGALGAWLVRALALALLARATADVVFRVPEVIVRPISGAKSVGIGPSNVSRANDSERWGEPDVVVQYEEYVVEHEVSTADARKAAAALKLEEPDELQMQIRKLVAENPYFPVPATPVGCGVCSQRNMEYCETSMLADHCCCERSFGSHSSDPFPWLPHTCYLGPIRCRPLAGDCVRYTRLRDCCCARKLAERWKSILSKSSSVSVGGASLLLSILLLVAQL